jgi:hypothetical protein
MFKNYAHRAHVFAQAVQELSEMGEIEGTGASIEQRSDVAHVLEVKP